MEGGTNIASVTSTTGNDGQTIYTVNADGAKVSAGSDAVSVTAGTKDANNVTDYTVDLSDETKEKLADGLTFNGDTGTSDKVKLGDTLNVKGEATGTLTSGNIGVEADGDTLKIKLAKDIEDVDSVQVNKTVKVGDNITMDGEAANVTIGSLADGGTVLSQKGIRIVPATGSDIVQFTTEGISAGGQRIENVADGTADNDAVNVSQLTKAAAAAKTEVEGGTNIASVDKSTGTDGQTIYTINADGAKVSAGSDAVSVTAGTKDANNVTDYTVDLSEETKATLDKAENDGLTFAGDSGTSDKIKLGDTLNVTGGATGTLTDGNIGVTAEGSSLKVKLADNISLTSAGSVTIGSATEGGQTVLDQNGLTIYPSTSSTESTITKFTTNGISAGSQKITYVADGEDDTDAVNVRQLEKAKEEAISSVKLKFEGESGDTLERGNNETLQIVGDGTNITTKAEDDKIKVELSKDLQVDSIAAGDTVINTDGVTANKVTVGDTVIEDKKITMGDTEITDSSVTTNEVKAGNTTINDSGVTTNQVTVGDTTVGSDGLTIVDGPSVTKDGIDAGSRKITNVARGTEDSDAVNLAQLKEATSASKTVVEGGTNIASVDERTGEEGQSIYTVNAKGTSVSEGSDAVKVTTTEKADNVTDYSVDLSDKTKATLDKVENDGLTFAGDSGTSNKIKLGDTLNLKGGATGDLSDGNIGVEAEGDTLNIKLAKDIKDVDSIQVNKTVKVGDNITLDGEKNTIGVGGTNIADNKITMGDTSITDDSVTTNSVNANEVKAGDSALNSDGLTIANGPSFTKDEINAGGNRVTNMADGEEDSDAASMGQLRDLAENTGAAINNVSNQISQVDSRMKKGLAGAAALAALHPMDFDPDSKLTFAAGVGNYRGANAAALGAFYRPDERVMFSMGGTFGNGENMVNAGVSFALDRVNRISNTRTAMAHEIVELKGHIAKQDEQIAKLTALVNKLVGPENAISDPSMFPDVPENHWAYEYIADLQRRGALQGYPDGRFKGDEPMTRYEFAAMLDRALQNGVKLDARIAKEFEPELGRIYVQRISGADTDRNKIERVRVNNADKATRDTYGNKILTATPAKAASK